MTELEDRVTGLLHDRAKSYEGSPDVQAILTNKSAATKTVGPVHVLPLSLIHI